MKIPCEIPYNEELIICSDEDSDLDPDSEPEIPYRTLIGPDEPQKPHFNWDRPPRGMKRRLRSDPIPAMPVLYPSIPPYQEDPN